MRNPRGKGLMEMQEFSIQCSVFSIPGAWRVRSCGTRCAGYASSPCPSPPKEERECLLVDCFAAKDITPTEFLPQRPGREVPELRSRFASMNGTMASSSPPPLEERVGDRKLFR